MGGVDIHAIEARIARLERVLEAALADNAKLRTVAEAARALRDANRALEEAVCQGFDQTLHAGIHGAQYLAERELDAALAALEAT